MLDERGTVRRVAWREIFPWLLLFRTVSVAMSLRKMLLGAVAIALTSLGWFLLGSAFAGREGDDQLAAGVESYTQFPWQAELPLALKWFSGDGGTSENNPWTMQEPLIAPWQRLSDPVFQIFNADVSWAGLAFYASCALWALAVWSLFGGLISRIAALELARDEKPSLGAAWAHVRPKLPAYFAAPLLPLVGVLLGVIFLSPLGLLLRLDLGSIFVGALWCLALVAGLVFTIFIVGLVFGWPLMWGAISVEGQDSWDALNRAYSYVYQRPLHYLFYAALSGVLGFLAWMFVSLFAAAVIYLASWGVSWTSGGERIRVVEDIAPDAIRTYNWSSPQNQEAVNAPSPMLRAGADLVAVWSTGVKLLALGFGYSFFWTASTAIYLLLRRDTDDAPLDDIAGVEPPGAGLPKPTLAKEEEDSNKQPASGAASSAEYPPSG